MPVDLHALLDPAATALVTQECQNGVIGDDAIFPGLAEHTREMIPAVDALCRAARTARVPVVHCLALRRDDGAGANGNARVFGAAAKASVRLAPGSFAAQVASGIAVAPSDLVLTRYHGLGPMADTGLAAVLRNLGATTVVGVGVSLNVGMVNFAMDAVNAGFRFVIPREAVAGFPPDYAEAVLTHTLGAVATVTTTARVVEVWKAR
ncbi:cysteine hydrolase [Yinghuangia sp. ASG 101]|uniref:cysteine hydrolase n=1 Tax=Yinghuangia sp. ASG 101 TaxID=2896848 RepID=UPI001E5B273E|nr:cysteine hydrolase [Yinghuangia sp. ASG 101]UGQ09233.1 cysteine hydrolase [Yinghuangia sp. ASG 101]